MHQKCAKAHLQASRSQKNFPGGTAPWAPREGKGRDSWEGEGEEKGEKEKRGKGREGKEGKEGKGGEERGQIRSPPSENPRSAPDTRR